MSTLHDLRETLELHADGVRDSGHPGRSAAVRRRVRTARRRRTAAASVAAAIVVVGGVGLATSFQGPRALQAADNNVVGVAVPEEIAIHGFPYELAGEDSIEGEDDRLRLESSEELRAVSLVGSGLGSGSATLYVDDVAAARVFADDQVSAPVPVPAGDSAGEMRVELHDVPSDARTAVATYDATGEMAPGVTNGDVVFRENVGDARLLAAAFNKEDEARATISFQATNRLTSMTGFCETDETGLWFTVAAEKGAALSGMCGKDPDPDGSGSSGTFPFETGATQTLTAYVTRGRDGPVVEDADVRLGVAAYEPGDMTRVRGIDVSTVVEHAGRTWVLESTHDVAGMGLGGGSDLLLGVVAEEGSIVRTTWRGDFTSGEGSYADASTVGPVAVTDGLMLRGDDYRVALQSEDPSAPVNAVLLVYRPE